MPRLPSHWSSSHTVHLILVLRLLASAELWLYWTSLPPPDHLENHLIWVDSTKMIPLWLEAGCPWVHSRNPLSPGYSHDIIIAIMELDWNCTDMSGMRHQSWWRILWILKRPLVILLGRQGNPYHDVCLLSTNIQANRVAIVNSVLTKIFNPCKYWIITIQPFVNTQWFSACFVCCKFIAGLLNLENLKTVPVPVPTFFLLWFRLRFRFRFQLRFWVIYVHACTYTYTYMYMCSL